MKRRDNYMIRHGRKLCGNIQKNEWRRPNEMKKIGQMIKKYGNTVLLFLAVFSASEIGNKGCMFIFHQPEIPEELKNM